MRKLLDTVRAGSNPDKWVAIEFRTASPHGMRTGDVYQFAPTISQTYFLPITGAAQVALSGTATIASDGRTVTFSNSQTLANGTGLVFGSDTSAAAYAIGAVSGTTGTLSTKCQTASLPLTASTVSTTPYVNMFNVIGVVTVTGASTFAVPMGNVQGVTTGTTIQTVAATQEIPVTWSVTQYNGGSSGNVWPYSMGASAATTWAGGIPWLPLMLYMSRSCVNAIIDEIISFLPANSILACEAGLEHWNIPGFLTGVIDGIFGRTVAYLPPLTPVATDASGNPYYLTPSTGGVNLSNDQAYCLMATQLYDFAQARLDSYGTGIKVLRIFGSGMNQPNVTSSMQAFCCGSLGSPSTGGLQKHIPVGAYVAANYQSGPTGNTTWSHACATTGTNPGSLPVGLMNEFWRYWTLYSSSQATLFRQHTNTIAKYNGPTGYAGQVGSIPGFLGYEGGVTFIDPAQGSNGYGLDHDCFYHSSIADTVSAFFLSSGYLGMQGGCIFALTGNWAIGSGNKSVLWVLEPYQLNQSQLSLDGSLNQFTTTQGGSPGDGLCHDLSFTGGSIVGNVSVEMPALVAWFAGANSPPVGSSSSVPSPLRYFPGLSRPYRNLRLGRL